MSLFLRENIENNHGKRPQNNLDAWKQLENAVKTAYFNVNQLKYNIKNEKYSKKFIHWYKTLYMRDENCHNHEGIYMSKITF